MMNTTTDPSNNSSGEGAVGYQHTSASSSGSPSKDTDIINEAIDEDNAAADDESDNDTDIDNDAIDDDSAATDDENTEEGASLQLAEQALIDSIGNADPTSKLHEFYQSTSKNSRHQPTYRDVTMQLQDGSGLASQWWMSVLSCPMTNQDYHSSLPLSVLLGSSEGESAWKSILAKVGDYRELDDGYIWFKSKKGARKAAALGAYEVNVELSSARVMFRSKAEIPSSSANAAVNVTDIHRPLEQSTIDEAVSTSTSGDVNGSADDNSSASALTSHQRTRLGFVPRSSYPDWVERLHRLGVDPSSIEIKFREMLPSSLNEIEYLSKESPTQLCCVMKIASPLKMTAVSPPFQSRNRALESATLLIEEEACREKVSVPVSNEHDWSTKERLLCSVPEKQATFVFAPPACFAAPIEENSESSELFVYEMAFKTDSGDPFVPLAMGLSPRAVTRMAIVFGQDVLPGNESLGYVQTILGLPTRNGTDTVHLSLSRRTVLCLSGDEARDSLRKMKRFNSILCDWKRYGLLKWSRSRGSVRLANPIQWDDFGVAGNRRTCMFVPLRQEKDDKGGDRALQIDWDLITNVVNFELQPYFLTIDRSWRLLFVGRLRARDMGVILAVVSIACAAAASLLSIVYAAVVTESHSCRFEEWDKCIMGAIQNPQSACVWLTVLSAIFFLLDLVPPSRTVEDSTLLNRFLVQSAGVPGIFAMKRNGETNTDQTKNAFSTYHDQSGEEGLPPAKLSFFGFYLKHFGARLRYPKEALLCTKQVKGHTKESLLQAPSNSESVHLPPELVHILPCPRDIMCMFGQHVDKIMVPLERTVTLLLVELRLNELKEENSMHVTTLSCKDNNVVHPPSIFTALDEGDDFHCLLDKATRLLPQTTYQRLEFLGDAVLNYFLSIDLMARNAALSWDVDDLGELIQVAMKNKSLRKGAIHIGLSRLLGVGEQNKWKSAYSHVVAKVSDIPESSHLIYSDLHCRELGDGTLSDVVESLLAVAFMACSDGSVVVGILNELGVPGLGVRGVENVSRIFHGMNAALDGPYPFDLQKKWNEQITAVGAKMIVNGEINEALELGYQSLCNILKANMSGGEQLLSALTSPRTKILLRCALFDDSLEFDDSFTASTNSPVAHDTNTLNDSPISRGRDSLRSFDTSPLNQLSLDGFDLVGILRDNLFFVGNYALKLCVSMELYKRYPAADPGDLTLLTFCAFTDEVFAYMLVKNGLLDCLYDKDSPAAAKFLIEANLADKKGLEIWEKNGGWILDGIEDFRRRSKSTAEPRYPGIGGGLLTGHLTKLDPREITDELAFSMKAICGALVLGVGMENMWHCFCPMFDEVLLLTPEELCRLYGHNSVCKGSAKRYEEQPNEIIALE